MHTTGLCLSLVLGEVDLKRDRNKRKEPLPEYTCYAGAQQRLASLTIALAKNLYLEQGTSLLATYLKHYPVLCRYAFQREKLLERHAPHAYCPGSWHNECVPRVLQSTMQQCAVRYSSNNFVRSPSHFQTLKNHFQTFRFPTSIPAALSRHTDLLL